MIPAVADRTSSAPAPGMRLAWVTDPHFDHVDLGVWGRWADNLIAHAPDALIVTGDLSEGEDASVQLRRLAETFARPIYFVLGNHDFYGSSIGSTRRRITDLSREIDYLHYLTDLGAISLTEHAVLVGDDGWGDASEGDYQNTTVRLNDFQRIDDFRLSPPEQWRAILQREGHDSAQRLAIKLAALPACVTDVLVATHVPPFRQACLYEGQVTDDNWAPFFVWGGVAPTLRSVANAHPHRMHHVLCGHTHHEGDVAILPNLHVHTGYSRYGTLDTEAMLILGKDGFDIPPLFAAK